MEIDILQWLGFEYLVIADNRIYWGYLVLALLLALIVSRATNQKQQEWLGSRIWWHPSARLDYRYFVVTSIIKASLIAPLLLSAGDVAVCVMRLLDEYLGYRPKLATAAGSTIVFYTICLFLVNDFTRYWLHRLMHRIPALWAIHKIHHSAEVLTPMTFYRVHPFENWLFGLRYALGAGIVSGTFVYLFGAGLNILQIFGVNAFVLFAHLLGDNLRHSHLRLRYPAWLEHILISPQQHQYHHTLDGNHHNYGGVLSLWDWCFGSLRLSRANECYVFGLAGETPHRSVAAMLLAPIVIWLKRKHLTYAALLTILCVSYLIPVLANDNSQKIALGRALFFDPNLSLRGNQTCATCHDPERGFIETRASGVGAAASLGDDLKSLGGRNTPTLSYVATVPTYHNDNKSGQAIGGLFWDGRAKDLTDQAGQPILNPIEMGMPDKMAVVARINTNESYRRAFKRVFGDNIFDETGTAYRALAEAIAAFEQTAYFSPYDSKYDRYLRGDYELTDLEDLGMSIFFSTTNSNCSTCHQLKVMDDEQEPFSNFEYHNIGTPTNPALRRHNGVAVEYRDLGLGGQLTPNDPNQIGRFRVPTLRNVVVTGPYMHNGVFRDLRTVIEFYDQYNNPERINNPETNAPWRNAEVKETVNLKDLKAKKLNDRKINALLAFLKTLTDKRYEHLVK